MYREIDITTGKEIAYEGAGYVPDEAQLAANVRAQRGELLSLSDWTQLPDAPVNKAAWADYRQALRDIPKQPGFPMDIEWPKKPE